MNEISLALIRSGGNTQSEMGGVPPLVKSRDKWPWIEIGRDRVSLPPRTRGVNRPPLKRSFVRFVSDRRLVDSRVGRSVSFVRTLYARRERERERADHASQPEVAVPFVPPLFLAQYRPRPRLSHLHSLRSLLPRPLAPYRSSSQIQDGFELISDSHSTIRRAFPTGIRGGVSASSNLRSTLRVFFSRRLLSALSSESCSFLYRSEIFNSSCLMTMNISDP